jgi:threonine dehydratase
MQVHHQLIEGAAGIPVAALSQQQKRFQGQHVVLILCGANVSLQVLQLVLGQQPLTDARGLAAALHETPESAA